MYLTHGWQTYVHTHSYSLKHAVELWKLLFWVSTVYKETKVDLINLRRQLLCHFPFSCCKIYIKLHSLMHSTTLSVVDQHLEIEVIKTANLSFKHSAIIPYRLLWNMKLCLVIKVTYCVATIANQFMPSKIYDWKFYK